MKNNSYSTLSACLQLVEIHLNGGQYKDPDDTEMPSTREKLSFSTRCACSQFVETYLNCGLHEDRDNAEMLSICKMTCVNLRGYISAEYTYVYIQIEFQDTAIVLK